METGEVLNDAFERIRSGVHRAVEGLDARALAHRPDPAANSIAWLVWHTSRVQDDHVSEIAGVPQAYIADGFAGLLELPPDPDDIGYGHTSDQVARVRPAAPAVLVDYHDGVTRRTLAYLATIDAEELDRIIDDSYDPPVSVGVRLVSVINDSMQHVGQANYVRGLIERSWPV
jgi:hypothetical protein